MKIKLGDDRDFLVTLAREGDDALYLERKNGVTSLVSTRKEVSEVRFRLMSARSAMWRFLWTGGWQRFT